MQDEPFHVLQTQRYCRGDWWTWDPKITTFPGLYIVATVVAWASVRLGAVPAGADPGVRGGLGSSRACWLGRGV